MVSDGFPRVNCSFKISEPCLNEHIGNMLAGSPFSRFSNSFGICKAWRDGSPTGPIIGTSPRRYPCECHGEWQPIPPAYWRSPVNFNSLLGGAGLGFTFIAEDHRSERLVVSWE